MKRFLPPLGLLGGAVAVSLGLVLGSAVPTFAAGVIPEVNGAAVPSLAPMLARITPGVVNIAVKGKVREENPLLQDPFFRRFFNLPQQRQFEERETQATGSGVIVDAARGYVLSNAHVVENATTIEVTTKDNRRFPAKLIGRDAETDVAVLQIATQNLTAVPMGDSDRLQVGDFVLAIGNPFGLGGTVTSGIISATARDIRSGPYDEFLQTDASINRGNSGGPMFNLNGEVVGINTMIYSPSGGGSIGIGFAIPATLGQRIVEQLKATGKVERGWIGARIQPVTDEIAESVGLDKGRGAMVASIDAGSPAAQAKLLPGDVILSYDGKSIDRSRQLPRLVAETAPDKTARLMVWRDGKEIDVDLKVAALNPNRPAPPAPEPEKPRPPIAFEALGLKLAKLTPDLRKQFGISDAAKGIVVLDVPQNSVAATQGLRAGDLVVAAGGTALGSPVEVSQLASAARKAGRKNLLLRVEREGNTRFIALAVEAG